MVKRTRRDKGDFFLDLECMGGFFADIEEMIQRDKDEEIRLIKYWAKRARNLPKAQRLVKRINIVRDFDIWKASSYLERDFFGDNSTQHEEVKKLYAKQARLLWILSGLYNYWACDYPRKAGYRPKFSVQNEIYKGHIQTLKEKIKQEKWDKKRAKVRARRKSKEERDNEKNPKWKALQTIIKLRYGTPPVEEEITWD